MPARLAARIFSRIPPTGSTFPRRVISPVMARLAFTLRWVSAEASEVTMVIPAEGPSFGIAPSGTWIWMFQLSKIPSGKSSRWLCAFRYSSASMADSFITEPRLPVRVSCPFPRLRLVSTNRISPPTAVQASPVTTPAYSLPWYLSREYSCAPRNFSMSFGFSSWVPVNSSLAISSAILRITLLIFFSSSRTPLSRV